MERLRAAEKEIERVRVQSLLARAGALAAEPDDVSGVSFVGYFAEGAAAAEVRTLALDVRGRMGAERPAVVCVVGAVDGRPSVVVALNDAARDRGLGAGQLVRAAARRLGGNGGGKDDVAQGGGTDATAAQQAVLQVERAIGQRVTSS